MLEKAGFRVEGRYIPREEVERMLEEVRGKAVENLIKVQSLLVGRRPQTSSAPAPPCEAFGLQGLL